MTTKILSLSTSLLIAFAIFFPAFAETAIEPKEYVSLGKIQPVKLKQGQPTEVVIRASVLKGHHIQANPATLPNLISTEVVLEKIEGLTVDKTTYPKSKAWRLSSAGKEIQTYEGQVEFKVGLLAGSIKPGKYQLKGKLRYQACDEKNCFFPTAAEISVPLTVVK